MCTYASAPEFWLMGKGKRAEQGKSSTSCAAPREMDARALLGISVNVFAPLFTSIPAAAFIIPPHGFPPCSWMGKSRHQDGRIRGQGYLKYILQIDPAKSQLMDVLQKANETAAKQGQLSFQSSCSLLALSCESSPLNPCAVALATS